MARVMKDLRLSARSPGSLAIASGLSLALMLLAVAVGGCGSSGSDSDSDANEQALASLEHATKAASLQADMGDLVDKLSADPSKAQLADLQTRIGGLKQRAGELASGSTADPVETDIVTGAKQTRVALVELLVVTGDPGSGRANLAQRRALARMRVANVRLRRAVGRAIADLHREGGLSASERTSITRIRANLIASNRRLTASFSKLNTLLAHKRAAAAAAQQAAQAPPTTTAPTPEPTTPAPPTGANPCPPGSDPRC